MFGLQRGTWVESAEEVGESWPSTASWHAVSGARSTGPVWWWWWWWSVSFLELPGWLCWCVTTTQGRKPGGCMRSWQLHGTRFVRLTKNDRRGVEGLDKGGARNGSYEQHEFNSRSSSSALSSLCKVRGGNSNCPR
ncbi:hypothetical protein B0T17DRAFT_505456 [Bombardia bombarda]|uniref:Uncharacterized protein n=1 Tax=Bombardia bombarda TaxID=252184 RepID=A0AA40C8T5_9PEZI|nr:hypothetical protein B0T17DRAFT_505456 [Bombardia bombarda]